jgi:flagellar hook-length control protein FliK
MLGVTSPAPVAAPVPSSAEAGDAAAAAPAGPVPVPGSPATTTGDAVSGQPPAPVADTASPDTASPAAAAPTPEGAPSPTSAGTATGAGAPGAGSAVTSALPTTAAAAPADASPVTRQVFPEVTRLVSTGNGTHRVTLTLQPEQLGEVRVTLTVRDGEVLVRMAAGDEAQRALLEGAPELRRVLELTGATDTRIVVRDLPGTTPQPSASPAAGEGRDGSGLAGQAGDRTHDQHAGTRGGSSARDGSTPGAGDGTTGGATPPAPGRPVTGTRAAGLDVTL